MSPTDARFSSFLLQKGDNLPSTKHRKSGWLPLGSNGFSNKSALVLKCGGGRISVFLLVRVEKQQRNQSDFWLWTVHRFNSMKQWKRTNKISDGLMQSQSCCHCCPFNCYLYTKWKLIIYDDLKLSSSFQCCFYWGMKKKFVSVKLSYWHFVAKI
jgi:hypothetical protein